MISDLPGGSVSLATVVLVRRTKVSRSLGRRWVGQCGGQRSPSEASRLLLCDGSQQYIGLTWPSEAYLILLWVLQVVGSNPAAPTNKIKHLAHIFSRSPAPNL